VDWVAASVRRKALSFARLIGLCYFVANVFHLNYADGCIPFFKIFPEIPKFVFLIYSKSTSAYFVVAG
jgi:hypothetical protein